MYMYMCMYFKVYTSVLTRMGTFTDVWVHVFSIDVGIHIYIFTFTSMGIWAVHVIMSVCMHVSMFVAGFACISICM